MTYFFVDHTKNIFVTWEELINKIKQTQYFYHYCKDVNTINTFEQIILALILDKKLTLLDKDFTESEIINLTGEKNIHSKFEQITIPEISDVQNLINNLASKQYLNFSLTLYTSGTTGIPKKVEHNFDTLFRSVRKNNYHKDDVWGFAYNPTHIAGVLVFFQAFFNGNTLVNIFNKKPYEIFESIKNYRLTHISATPSFFRLLLPSTEQFTSIKSITSGGEKFDKELMEQLKNIFPNATFKNIYALTESGSLFYSFDDYFVVKNIDKVKIVDNILYVHKSLLGNFDISEEWYNTGDLVEIVEENPLKIKFISREKEIINVGGYKVNPYEVENVLKQIPEIKDAVVYSKKNAVLGNIVVADVVCYKKITEEEIRSFLQKHLQEFKIPRLINFIENIEISRTGKTKRI